MHEKIDESVRAVVYFTGETMLIRSFVWRNRKYSVERTNMIHRVRDGSDWLYFYAIFSGFSCYKLCFSTRTLSWRLLEIYTDG